MKQASAQNREPDAAVDVPRRESLERIWQLQRASSRGLWLMSLFLLLSLGAYGGFKFIPPFWTSIEHLLGPAPSPNLISTALFLYLFSAIVLTLGRMMEGKSTRGGWQHLGYLAAFYVFYCTAGVLEEYFWAVFAAGITVLGLEGYRIWNTCTEMIREIEEEIDRITRLANFS